MRKHWTVEEIEALKAGVAKYGAGMWKCILTDPEFESILAGRSNVNLKDKWRNLCAYNEQGWEENSLTPKRRVTASNAESHKTKNNSSVSTFVDKTNENLPRIQQDVKNTPTYSEMILEAISSVKDPSGTDIGTIMGFIQQKYKVPQNFRRSLTSELRRLVTQGKLDKVKNVYKIKDQTALGLKTPTPKQKDVRPRPLQQSSWLMMEDAARKAAREIAEAENKALVTDQAVKHSEWVSQMAYETEQMLTLCKEFFEKCDRFEFILMDQFF